MLAFSSFGSVPHPISKKVADAVEIVRRKNPNIIIDGEMHLDTAVVEEIVEKNYPHSRIKGDANVLVFPDLTSGNIGYKLVQRLGGRRGPRADPAGRAQAGERAAARHDRGRHRQRGGHHRHVGGVAGDGAGFSDVPGDGASYLHV